METFYYSYDDATKIIYWSTYFPEDRPELIYLGISDNENKRMAAQVLFNNRGSGFRLRELV
jgi:hypothetical protein